MEKIGKYELIREVGHGATSTVYLGSDPFTQREVAVKVAFPGILKDPKRGKLYTHLFLNEAALIGKLSHPHIVQTYDAVVDDHSATSSWNTSPAARLETVCAPGSCLPVERVVEIIFKCTRALDFRLPAGITHRDIKPANILLTCTDHRRRRHQDLRFRCRDHRLTRPHAGARDRLTRLHVAATGQGPGARSPDRHLLARRRHVPVADRSNCLFRRAPVTT
jgi:serine/threonine protein kinase